MIEALSPTTTALFGATLASWAALAISAFRAPRSGRWSVTSTAIRIVLGLFTLASIRALAPDWPAAAIGPLVALGVLSAEGPAWLRAAAAPASTDIAPQGAEPDDAALDAEGSPAASFDEVRLRFLHGLVSLKSKTVAQAMVPREHMVTVNQDWSVGRAAKAIGSSEYARIPVVGRDPREVVGVVHRKDLLLLLHSRQEGTFVKNISRDVAFVPGSQRLDRLLVKFQKERLHLAIVPDEYGRAAGLITMDDILSDAFAPEAGEAEASKEQAS